MSGSNGGRSNKRNSAVVATARNHIHRAGAFIAGLAANVASAELSCVSYAVAKDSYAKVLD